MWGSYYSHAQTGSWFMPRLPKTDPRRGYSLSIWIQTYLGVRFYPFEPKIEDIYIADIAQALSQSNRFAGHTSVPYSIAQHCELVSHACSPENALKGLLHDAEEAYLVDIPAPIKQDPRFAFYREAGNRLRDLIFERFGLPPGEPVDVKSADWSLCQKEAWSLMPGEPIDGWAGPRPRQVIVPLDAEEARKAFLKRFYELYALSSV